jgi:hypothetical protein
MSCSRCQELGIKFSIRSPGELQKAIRVVRANLADGTLEQQPGNPVHPMLPFLSLTEVGPWDDYLLYEFRCTSCGARFTLSVETYHGAGGSWTPG